MVTYRIASTLVRKLETSLSPVVGKLWQGTFDNCRLSQAGFMSLCDGFYPSGLASLIGRVPDIECSEARVVYVQSDLFEEFLAKYPNSKARVLVIGNSDRDWNNFVSPPLPFLRHCFIQNLDQEAPESISALPIGIENRSHGRNGMPWNFTGIFANRRKNAGIFFGPMGKTHTSRAVLDALDVRNIPNLIKLSTRMSSLEFSWRSSRWTHVLAPRGNGIDTHRFWETLYRGSTPVVLKSDWSSNMKKHGMPLIEVEAWSLEELGRVSASLRANEIKPASTSALRLNYWRDLIAKSC